MTLYETCKQIVQEHGMRKFKRQRIDVQSANAYILIYEHLNEENKQKLAGMSPGKAIKLCWELVEKRVTATNEIIQDFEYMRNAAEARALSAISLERPLNNDEFERFRKVCKLIGISSMVNV